MNTNQRTITRIFSILVLIFLSAALKAQRTGTISYTGGTGKIADELGRAIMQHIQDIKGDHYLFFELTVGGKKKGLLNIVELYNEPGTVSDQVMKGLNTGRSHWSNKSRKSAIIIVPVILFKDNEGRPKEDIVPFQHMKDKYRLRQGFISSPIVITFSVTER